MFAVKPRKIRLEASSFCQLKCPSCPTPMGLIEPTIGRGFLKLDDFKKLIVENPFIKEIELSNYGEIFLNPQMLDILKFAFQQKVRLYADNGVNLNHVKENVLKGIVQYQLRRMTCSIDGVDNQTYQQYRIKGNFDKVIDNIRRINHFKKEYQSPYPLLTWQFIAFGHNEHVIEEAQKMAQALGMRFFLKLSWDENLSPVKNNVHGIRKLTGGFASRSEFKTVRQIDYMHSMCHQLWDNPQINWDGKLLGCCRNFWGDFGSQNIFRDGFIKTINNKKIKYARQMLLGKQTERPDIPCTSCSLYLDMKRNKKWLDRSFHRKMFMTFKSLIRNVIYKISRKEIRFPAGT